MIMCGHAAFDEPLREFESFDEKQIMLMVIEIDLKKYMYQNFNFCITFSCRLKVNCVFHYESTILSWPYVLIPIQQVLQRRLNQLLTMDRKLEESPGISSSSKTTI